MKSKRIPVVNGALATILCVPRSDLASIPVGYHFTVQDTSPQGAAAVVLDVANVAVTTNIFSLDSYPYTPAINPYTLSAPTTFQGAWSTSSTYTLGNTVAYAGSTYISLSPSNAGNAPDPASAYWALVAPAGPQGPPGPQGPVGPTGPANPDGLLLNPPNGAPQIVNGPIQAGDNSSLGFLRVTSDSRDNAVIAGTNRSGGICLIIGAINDGCPIMAYTDNLGIHFLVPTASTTDSSVTAASTAFVQAVVAAVRQITATSGSIDGVPIGTHTPAEGVFTKVTATGLPSGCVQLPCGTATLDVTNNNTPSVPLGFSQVFFSAIVTDTASGWNGYTNQYTVPITGTYLIVTKLRLLDGTSPGISYGQGAGTAAVDAPYFNWFSSQPTTRQGSINTRISHFNVGDQIQMYSYADTAQTAVSAEMAISLLSEP